MNHADVKLTPTRTSIPVLSTKNNLLEGVADSSNLDNAAESVKMGKYAIFLITAH